MDYDKLIDRLNTKLQSYVSYTDSEFARAMEDAITAIETLRADLARVTAERDGAEKEITRLKAIMREKGIFTIPAKYPWEAPEWNW